MNLREKHRETIRTKGPIRPSYDERLAALETEIRDMKERAAAATVSNADVVKMRDAITGPPAKG